MNHDQWRQLVGIVCVNLATLAWASNMVIGRLLREAIGPIALSSGRFLIAALFFAALLRLRPTSQRRPGRDFWLLAAMAVTGVVAFSPLLYLGLHYTTVANGTIINGLAPLLTGLLATWLLKEPMSGRQIGGAAAALAGVVFLITGDAGLPVTAGWLNIGDLFILAAVAFWGLYSVLGSKVMRNRSSVSATALSTFIGLPLLLAILPWELQAAPVKVDATLLMWLSYLGLVPAALGFYAWNAGVARLGPSGAMVFYNTLPLYGALLGSLFLHEPVGMHHLLGGLLIVGGGLWAARKGPAGADRKNLGWSVEPQNNEG